jgi:IclR family acetate operon transcriptional repressor
VLFRSAPEIAAELGLAPSSARRLIGALVDARVLIRLSHGRYAAGPALEELAGAVALPARLRAAAQTPLRRLARATGATAHLGILEGDMVTYLARESADPDFDATRVGTQLEAYCTGIGKVLLASLAEGELSEFLAGGPFVPITQNTTTDPEELQAQIREAAQRGFATDDGEMFDNVRCIAVPVHRGGRIVAAASLSRLAASFSAPRLQRDLSRLKACADDIATALG